MFWLALAIIGIFVLALLAQMLQMRWQKHRLHGQAKKLVAERWQQATAQGDPHRRIIEIDAVLDMALTRLGYKGTLGEKLKKAAAYIPDYDAVWKAHKLRNRIAHEPGVSTSAAEVLTATRAIGKVIERFCR